MSSVKLFTKNSAIIRVRVRDILEVWRSIDLTPSQTDSNLLELDYGT